MLELAIMLNDEGADNIATDEQKSLSKEKANCFCFHINNILQK